MASIRDTLKDFFSRGKKPTEGQFHELIDSFYHKTEDGLIMSAEGNLGIGVDTPDARLHVDGALKIGDAAEEAKMVPGTLRWTGTKLQVAFGGAWNDVWAEKTATQVTVIPPPFAVNKKATSATVVQSAALTFPTKTIMVQEVSFTIDYESKDFQSGFGGRTNTKTLSIALVTSTGIELWSNTPTAFPKGNRTGIKLGPYPVTGAKSVEGVPSFFIKFSITGGLIGSLSVTVKDVTVKLLAKV